MYTGDLHRHDEFSTYDGFGKPKDLAKIAKAKGHSWLGISNHGTTAGNIQHYFACKDVGIKPILGVECYHEPVFDREKKNRKSYHLCLFAKDLVGYKNINKIMTEAENNKYYTSRVTFDILKKYHEGIICTTACVGSYPAQALINGKTQLARKWLTKMKQLFGDDLYVEIQPYKVTKPGMQEGVNLGMLELADEQDIKCILTSDSHRGKKEEIDSYLKMHEVAKHDGNDIEATYKERYMPTAKELYGRYKKMHKPDGVDNRAREFMQNLSDLSEKVEPDIIDQIDLQMPIYDDSLSKEQVKERFVDEVRKGLKRKGKLNKKTKARCMKEIDVIDKQGFNDYFLIVQDYVKWAQRNDIMVGHGRGSVCNSEVAYAMGITNVDSMRYNLDFNRFMRHGKNKIPDIDLDFETKRRREVITYILQRYPRKSAQIASYGLYKVKNLLNDLFKVCGVESTADQTAIKTLVTKGLNAEDEIIPREAVEDVIQGNVVADDDTEDICALVNDYNRQYDNIIWHFYSMYLKIKYYGTHAAGVAITAHDITDYVALRKDKDGNWFCVSDLVDLERINVVKFDILGLTTLDIIKDLRKETGETEFREEWTEDKAILDMFRDGATDGIFQFDKPAPQSILQDIQTDCFEDIIATNAMNRPASLQLGMPQIYASHKQNQDELKSKVYWKYVSETYGCIIYQEQVLAIAINIGGFTADEADILVKMEHGAGSRTKQELSDKYYDDFKEKFVSNAIDNNVDEDDAIDLFNACAQYGFNKGHSTGYSFVSIEEAYYKKYYPAEYFYVKIKYAKNDADEVKFCVQAFANDIAVFTPHMNHSDSKTCMRVYDGEKIIQKGLSTIKGVGEKAGDFIQAEREQNGKFKNYDDFEERCKCRSVTSKVRTLLLECGACDTNHKRYINRVIKYNKTLALKGVS